MVAAPVAVRTVKARASHQSSLVIRRSAWPAQRLQRFSSSSKLLQLREGKNKFTTGDHARFMGLLSPLSPALVTASTRFASPCRDLPPDRLAFCLRC
jgi:hypothetical protein